MNRALRAATVGVLLLTPVALSACSSGQVNQTASQVRDKVGASADLGDLTLRQVMLGYPTGGRYTQGSDAELHMAIANGGPNDDALVGVKGADFSSVRVTGTGVGARTTGSPGPTSPAAPTAATPTAATSPAVTPPPAAPTATGPAAGPRPVDIPVPAHETVFLGQNAPTITLVGLSRPLTVAQSIPVTFTFREAGEITLDVTVDTPNREASRLISSVTPPLKGATE